MSDASGPNPNGCALCGHAACDRKAAGTVAVSSLPTAEYEAATERYRVAVATCEARGRVDWQAECARLTAQLAAATEALASAEVAIETLEARVEAAEREVAAATARAGAAETGDPWWPSDYMALSVPQRQAWALIHSAVCHQQAGNSSERDECLRLAFAALRTGGGR